MELLQRYEAFIDSQATGKLAEQLKKDSILLSEFKSFTHKFDNRTEMLKIKVDNRTCHVCAKYLTCEDFETNCKRFVKLDKK